MSERENDYIVKKHGAFSFTVDLFFYKNERAVPPPATKTKSLTQLPCLTRRHGHTSNRYSRMGFVLLDYDF